MTCTLTVPFWPTSYDNLHWSKDNRIAVLGGEHILILTPRLHEATPGRLWWDTEHLVRINAFTVAEYPRAAVLTDRNTSIGEELSVFHAHAAAWSPSGLAKYGDSALAVLTSNHILSVWSPEAKAQKPPVWKRTVVVNHVVRKFYEDLEESQPEGSDGEQERDERLQVQQRVRSFAWLQPVYDDLERPHPGLFSGIQHLVVATAGGHLLLVRVNSPYSDPFAKITAWSAVVIECLALTHATKLVSADGNPLLQPTIALPRLGGCEFVAAGHIAVGEWQAGKSDGKHFAALVFIVEGRLFSTVLYHKSNALVSFGPPSSVQWHFHERADMTGPLKVTPGTDAGSLTFFGTDTVFHGQLILDAKKQTVSVDVHFHHLDDRWDDVSGTVITSSAEGDARLHVISNLSSSTAPTHTLRLPLKSDDDAVDQAAWHCALSNAKAAYGATYDIGDNVQERTWGIACAPVGGYTATCASMHPNDVVAYVINAEQTSILNITLESDMSADPFKLSPGTLGISGGLPTSTALFFLKRHLERRADAEKPSGKNLDSLVKDVIRTLSSEQSAELPPPLYMLPLDTLKVLLCKTRIRILADQDVRHAHATRICNMAAGNTAVHSACTITIVRQVADVLFSLTSPSVELNMFSMCLRRIYDIALSKLDSNYKLGDIEPSAQSWSEECKICGYSIAFESFKWARCGQGHQFGRCALSLLAIQEPGTTKHCGVCNLQYLDETAVAEFKPANQDVQMVDDLEGEVSSSPPANDMGSKISQGGDATARSTITLAELIFAACDVCIYCGGRFKG